MSFIKNFIHETHSLDKREKLVLIQMFNNMLVNEDQYDLEDSFDKIIEKNTVND